MSDLESQPNNTNPIPAEPQDEMPNATNDPEGAIPPGEEWMTHGGYLGCLIAITFGCLLASFVASPLVRGLSLAKQGTAIGFVVGAIILMLLGIIIFGRMGWWIGKRVYREYPESRRSQSLAHAQEEPVVDQ